MRGKIYTKGKTKLHTNHQIFVMTIFKYLFSANPSTKYQVYM